MDSQSMLITKQVVTAQLEEFKKKYLAFGETVAQKTLKKKSSELSP
jgi:hypothetical protein